MAKPKQEDIPFEPAPGVTAKKIPAIEKAANKFIEFKTERLEAKKREGKAEAAVVALLMEHKDEIGVDANGEILYRYDTHLILVKPGKEKMRIIEVGSANDNSE